MASSLSFLLPSLWLLLFFSSNPKMVWAGEFEDYNVLEMVVANETAVAAPAPGNFDYYILALQWPPSICTQTGRTCRDFTVPKIFTIHGLWPASSSGTSVINCQPTSAFDWAQIMQLDKYPARELNTKWPTLSNTYTQQTFFRMEWEKHGSCSGLTQLEYFKLALKLYDNVNLYNRLRDSAVAVTPSATKTYDPSNIIDKYYNKWKLLIKIKCVNSKTSEMIGEIHSKISKNGAIVESIPGSTNMCTTTSVKFPEKA